MADLKIGDLVVCAPGDHVPVDGGDRGEFCCERGDAHGRIFAGRKNVYRKSVRRHDESEWSTGHARDCDGRNDGARPHHCGRCNARRRVPTSSDLGIA